MAKDLMPSILDREIDSESNDAFGHRHFSAALESLIESPKNTPPFSVGLLGKWGSGKSSIKSMYLKQLADNRNNGTVFPVTFNAWRYGGEDLKRALLRHVYLAAGGERSVLDDALFNALEETIKRKLNWKEVWEECYERILWPLVQIFVAALCLGMIGYFLGKWLDFSIPWTPVAFMAGMAAIGWKLFEKLPELSKILLSRTSSVVRVDAPRSTAEQFHDLLINQIKDFKTGVCLSGKGKKCERLVVFVDDLDRLSAEEMVAGLDAIRTFMEIPFETTGVGMIFVISCDEDRIADALFRNKRAAKDMPGAVFSRSDARRYLDRIFQFRLEIPELPKRDMRAFAMKRLRDEVPEIVAEFEKAGVAIESVIDRMIHVGVSSPRAALQILNSFIQSWWIAKKREHVGPGTDRPGGLQQGAVTNHPISLAALSALRVDFPDFFHQLVDEPDLIERFTAVFIRSESLDDQPESTRSILSEYQDSDGKFLVKYRPLKRFLNGLAGLRWPQSLRALLILSQDPITRKHGDKAVRLYEAFVSAESDEVLRILGRDSDKRTLDISEVSLLKDMVEDLERETPVRRDNAAACLAQMADRLPDGQAHHLLSPLARRLSHSPELRARLGIEKIRNVLPQTPLQDRRDVAGRLVSDLLLLEGETGFRLPNGQMPSIEDAIAMAESACQLALWVRDSDGLSPSTDERLLRWLEVRRIAVNGKEHSMPFSELERWVSDYEPTLLLSLKDRYSSLVADELEANSLDDALVGPVLRKCRAVFNILWKEGSESQSVLWHQLSRFATVKNSQAVSVSWEEMLAHPSAPNDAELSAYVGNFAERLTKDAEENSEWEMEWEKGGAALITLLRNRQSSLDASAEESLADLTTAWGKHEVCGNLACDVMNVLVATESEHTTEIMEDWIGRILTDLPKDCVTWCGNNFDSCLTDAQRSQVVGELNQLTQAALTDKDSETYAILMEALPQSAMVSQPLAAHLTQVFALIQSNPNELYLKGVFPVVVPFLKLCKGSEAGNMIQGLFVSTRGNLSLYCWLHDQMNGHWFEKSQTSGSYEPRQLFDEAIQTIESSPNVVGLSAVLRSIHGMVKSNPLTTDSSSRLVGAACLVWPHHSEAASEVLQTMTELPEPKSIVTMFEEMNLGAVEDARSLKELWSHFGEKCSLSMGVDVGLELLGKPPRTLGDVPDLGMNYWLVSMGSRVPEVLRTLVFNGNLTDDQRKRVWHQIDQRHLQLGREYIIEVLPDLLRLPESPEMTRAVIDSSERLNALFPSFSEKYDLAKLLLGAYLSSPSRENQNRIIEWVKTLGVDDVLRELSTFDPVSEEDLETLRTAFPGSRHLRKVKVKADDVE